MMDLNIWNAIEIWLRLSSAMYVLDSLTNGQQIFFGKYEVKYLIKFGLIATNYLLSDV